MAAPQPARRTGNCAVCFAALFAVALTSFLSPAAPRSGFAGAATQAREVAVARAVQRGGYRIRGTFNTAQKQTDEDLHGMIADARKAMFLHRMDVFRKRKPARKNKCNAAYKIAIAKTVLKARELEQKALQDDAEERPVFADLMTAEECTDAFKRFSKMPGVPQGNKREGNRPSVSQHPEKDRQAFEAYWAAKKPGDE